MKQLFTLFLLCFSATLFAQPYRTVTFTGNVGTDFKTYEKNGSGYAISWDTKYLYIGVTGGGTYIKDEPTLVYIDTLGAGGRDTMFNYDNRKGALPFTANCVVFFKAGYGEVRRDSAASADKWSIQKVVTDSIRTGTNDIEIRLPWSVVTGKNKVPANFGALFFKENGNGSQSDAYMVKPGASDKNDDYSADVTTEPIQLYYRFRTETKFYNNINVFSWITNKAGNLCAAAASTSVTLITGTSARLNWAAVAGAKQYEVRRRQVGTTPWLTNLVPGTKTYYLYKSLTTSTSYEWLVSTLCDTTGTDIASGFTPKNTFTTASSRSIYEPTEELLDQNTNELVVYPVPARRGSTLNVSSPVYKNNSTFTLFNVAGTQIQKGIINGGSVNLNSAVVGGTYILELKNNNSVVRKKVVIME